MPDVVDNQAQHRFELVDDGHLAELVYERHDGQLVLVHTGVPDELGGRGVGGHLVRAALNQARRDHLTVVPRCPFAKGWIEKHPDAVAGIEVSV